ncbi:MAG: PorT family protein [Bacteroidaceae bacterium]|nr:PorT family protein [Bacteroidaceae bacterium]
MKRLFLVATVLMLSVASIAQSEVGTLSIKPRAGINIAYFGESQNSMWSVSTSPRIGVAAGFELEYLVQKRVGISAGVIYSQQGEKGETGNWYSKISMKAKTDYINFPILANVYLYKGLALKLGVQPGVNVNASYTAGDYNSGDLSDVGINIKKFDLSLPFGLSFAYKFLEIDARYCLGVTNIVSDDSNNTWNRVVQITAGLKLDILKRHRSSAEK